MRHLPPVDSNGIPDWIASIWWRGCRQQISNFDDAVGWAHTYTAEANVLNTTCQNCHGVNGAFGKPSTPTAHRRSGPGWHSHTDGFLEHAMNGFTSRQMMDKAETLVLGNVYGSTDGSDGVCLGCHVRQQRVNTRAVTWTTPRWIEHLTQGRVAESVWEQVSLARPGARCGW